MNERIRELIEQATSYLPGRGPYNGLTFDVFDKEKFAELIVRECVESIPADGHRGDFGRAVEFCQQQIKQHFGVDSQ